MTIEEMANLFEKHDDEFIRFERVANPASRRRDMCAFLILERLAPGDGRMVSAAAHDEFWIGVDAETVAKNATEEDIITLIRCGVGLDDDFDSFCMFA